MSTETHKNSIIENDFKDFVTLKIDKQIFGIPVLDVHDILRQQAITRVPLAKEEIAGVMNIRGRIVTVINVRACLSLPPQDNNKKHMNVVISYQGELFSLQVDGVGEVLSLSSELFEKNPLILLQ